MEYEDVLKVAGITLILVEFLNPLLSGIVLILYSIYVGNKNSGIDPNGEGDDDWHADTEW